MAIFAFVLFVGYIVAVFVQINYQFCETLSDARKYFYASIAETIVVGCATGTIFASALADGHWLYWVAFGLGVVLCIVEMAHVNSSMNRLEALGGNPVL